MGDDRKSVSVWLKPRHQRMVEEMPDVSLSDITREAIEELFEGRSDREYALLCLEEDLAEVTSRWERLLGLNTSITVTSTEDGFRIVMVPLKNYGPKQKTTPPVETEPAVETEPVEQRRAKPVEISDIRDVLDEWDDEDD